jgi:hypothetical protein
MTRPSPSGRIQGLVFQVVVDADGNARVVQAEVDLGPLEVIDGELGGSGVVVECRVVHEDDTTGTGLVGRPMDPIVETDGRLVFEPRDGGVRTRENRLARGGHNEEVADALSFGMVNAFHHSSRGLGYFGTWLDELGGPPLPDLRVVVGAHSGSRLPGFGQGDGDYRSGRMRPLTGGHYRLSRITSGVPEVEAVAATGEVHLGPGRRARPFGGHDAYLHNGAHNPTTIYHELGHHLCRHTADFRLNGRRRPDAQRNGKPAVEEGVCDYFAAALVGTGRAFSWYDRRRGVERDLDRPRRLSDVTAPEPHAIGAVWGASWWRARQELTAQGHLESASDHDRIMIGTLLTLGRATPRPGARTGRRETAAFRSASATVIGAYLATVAEHASPAAAQVAGTILEEAGLTESVGEGLGAAAC